MKLNAVGVASTNLAKTVEFYKTLGFEFGDLTPDNKHVESIPKNGSARLLIDFHDVIEDILGESPKPSNHSGFAVEFENPEEVDQAVEKIRAAGFKIAKAPWDAFWGQRYAIVEDPDGYKVDVYAQLQPKSVSDS